MPESPLPSGPAFLLTEPKDEERDLFQFPVSLLGYPKMWFRHSDDVIDVHERLQRGEKLETIHQSMSSGQSSMHNEYRTPLGTWGSPVKPVDAYNMVNVNGDIMDMAKPRVNEAGWVEYRDPAGKIRRRTIEPAFSEGTEDIIKNWGIPMAERVPSAFTGAAGSVLGGLSGGRWGGLVGGVVGTVLGAPAGVYLKKRLERRGNNAGYGDVNLYPENDGYYHD